MSANNNIKFTYKRKDNNIYHNLNNKKIRILNESGNEIVQENEIINGEVHSYKFKTKKRNLNDISSYFNKKIPKENNEIKNNPPQFMKSKRTIESYFQVNPTKDLKEKTNSEPNTKVDKENNIPSNDKKKFTQKKNYEQLYINFGQKGISPIICSECGMPYSPGIQDDVLQHNQYHNIIIDGLEYNGYKTDKIVQNISKDIYISKVAMSETTPSHKKKLGQILNLIEKELGSVKLEENINQYKFFLYIKNKKLIGCAIVKDVKEGYKIEMNENIEQITTMENINESEVLKVPTLCGISRIWVSRKERKKGIATYLLNCIRKNFLFNMTLEHNQIAFSQPTKLGTKLAYHFFNYTNSDNENTIIIPQEKYIIIYMDDDN